ncbi:MAG: hypothetical protein JW941_03180 [Candidatus Coatesbacteria bacterium]|nr:hypothetical protein [Candidatus Coatesbacteria bacterium]
MAMRNLSMLTIIFTLVAVLMGPTISYSKSADGPDQALVEAIEHLLEAAKKVGPESIEFPWDPAEHESLPDKEPPEFTSYCARITKIGENPRVRSNGDSITSTMFVGTKKVGERFKVENWRISWKKKAEGYVADSREVVQSYDDLFIPFYRGERRQDKGYKPFPRKVYEFKNLQFEHDRMKFSMPSGKLVAVEVDGNLLAGYVVGKGSMDYRPPTQLASDIENSTREVEQLKLHLDAETLEGVAFTSAVIWGHPEWMRAFMSKLETTPIEDEELVLEASDVFFDLLIPRMRTHDLAFGETSKPLCLLPSDDSFFYVGWDTPRHDVLFYIHNPSAVREEWFGGREKRDLSKSKYKGIRTYCEYDALSQRTTKSQHQLEHEEKDLVKTMSWSVDVKFEKGALDKVKKGKFEILFEYETLEPNATHALFEFYALTPTALTDAGGNDILFFDMGNMLFIPVDPVDGKAGRMNMLYAEGRDPGDIDWTYGYMDGWLPDTGYLDCTDFDLTITVPDKFQVVSVGKPLGEELQDGYRTKRWVGEHCTRFPGFVIGELFALESEADGIPIVVYSKDNAQAKKYVLPEIESSLNFYSKLFGQYPYSKLSACPINWGHGRGFATFITITGRQRTTGDWQAGLYCHEVSHQWWGNLVGWFSPAEQWLSEGFAEMSTLMYLQSARDNDSVKKRLKDWGYNAKRLDEKGAIWLGGPRLRGAYFELTYHKGAYIMHMLRMMVGDDDIIRILRTFVEQFKWKRATTSDFQEVCELTLGRERLIEIGGEPSLRWFFDQWIYGTGYPKYEYSWSKRKAQGGSWEVVFKLRQVGDKLFRMPLPIWVYTKGDGRYLSRQIVFEKEHEFVLTAPEKPKRVELDPFNNVLCDIKETTW